MRWAACTTCGSTRVPWRNEQFDDQAQVWTGFQTCEACGQLYLYKRTGPAEPSVVPPAQLSLFTTDELP
jgi:hypothetical protein